MKLTKTMAVLAICIGAGLFALAGCKDNSGDGDTSGNKHAITMTVDATGDNIKVGGKAITDSSEMSEDTIVADTAAGTADYKGHELELQHCGKRFFKEISGGLNNTEGFRTNIVLNLKDGTWNNSTSKRNAGAGMIFDFAEYEKDGKTKTYDFFFLSFKPLFNVTSGVLITDTIQMNFERYTGVKKTKEGIYSRKTEAASLGKCYAQTAQKSATWDTTPGYDNIQTYKLTSGFIYDATAQTITIGVDVKQNTAGAYTVQVGKITYTLTDGSTSTSVVDFKKNWKTSFSGTKYAEVGDPAGTSSITGYTNWTHVSKDATKNLKGGVMVYGFAPYGTKPVATYYTCTKKAASNTTPAADTDYVGDWNRVNELDTRSGVKDYTVYEEGGVIHEYVEY